MAASSEATIPAMRRFALALPCLFAGVASGVVYTQVPNAIVYEGARLIIGDTSAPIENGAFVVQNSRLTAIGRRGALPVPVGAAHVDATGQPVMPATLCPH